MKLSTLSLLAVDNPFSLINSESNLFNKNSSSPICSICEELVKLLKDSSFTFFTNCSTLFTNSFLLSLIYFSTCSSVVVSFDNKSSISLTCLSERMSFINLSSLDFFLTVTVLFFPNKARLTSSIKYPSINISSNFLE